MTVSSRQHQLVEDFGLIENHHERLAAIVDAARAQPTLPAEERLPERLVPGCTSSVWLVGTCVDGRCHFRADCDSPLVRGLVVLLCRCYDEATPEDVVHTEPEVLERLGLLRDLSPTRRNGLAAVRRRIMELARSWA